MEFWVEQEAFSLICPESIGFYSCSVRQTTIHADGIKSFTMLSLLLLPAMAWLTLIGVTFYVGIMSPRAIQIGSRSNDKKKPIRVAFLHPDFGIGGAENLVVNAALALQNKGAHVTIFTAHHDVTHCFEETRGDGPLAKGVRVYGDWLPRTIAGKLYAFCAMLRILYVTLVIALAHAQEVDVFFVDQVSVSIPFLRALGKPVLFYGHFPDKLLSTNASGSRWKQAYRVPLDWLEEITTAASDRIVVNSKFTRSVFHAAFPRVKEAQELGILYPPVDVTSFETFEQQERAKLPPRNPNLLVSLNRFERKKNIALAVRALAHLKTIVDPQVFAPMRLVVAGGYDPNNQENLEHLKELQQEVSKLGLDKHVEFKTSVSDYTKKELLLTAQAIIYTPSNEHFGIVPVEAMVCGTPVIAVNSGGPLESILDGETGFLCESKPEAFGEAMAKVCGPANATRVAQMGESGRNRARVVFSLETFADTLYELVENLV